MPARSDLPDPARAVPGTAHRDDAPGPPDIRIAHVPAADRVLCPNTERALRADLAVFAAWCRGRRVAVLPAEPSTVAAFVDAMAATRAPATVRRYVASVAVAQRAAGHHVATGTAPVRLAIQRMYRRRGRRQAQARGLTWPLRLRLLEAAGDRLIDLRDRALLGVAYDAMLRRSELVALRVADLEVDRHGGATLLVRRGKSDPEGRGAVAYLARDTVALVREWLARSGTADGALFRSVAKGGRLGARLHASQVPRIFKAMARRAGLPPDVAEDFSGHSARVGAAQDMVAAGIELPAILQAGRWKTTTMVNRYGERLLAQRSGAARLARLQGRE